MLPSMVSAGFLVTTFIIPPMALPPYRAEPGPLITSMRSTSPVEIRFQFTEPPSALFTGIPFSSTSVRACSFALTPRIETVARNENRPYERAVCTPGSRAKSSSTLWYDDIEIRSGVISSTLPGISPIRLSVLVADTTTSSIKTSSSSKKISI